MEKPVEHDLGSGAATVAGSTAVGAVKGALFVPAVVLGVGVAAVAAVALLPWWASALALGTGALAAVSAPVWMPFAGIGAAIGAYKGGAKVKGEQKAFDVAAHNIEQNAGATIQEAQQQAYMAGMQQGVQEGQSQVINKLREVQAAQEQQAQQAQQIKMSQEAYHPADDQKGKFADRFKKDSIAPEAIAQKREAAAHAAPQVG